MYDRDGIKWTRVTDVSGRSKRVSMDTKRKDTGERIEWWHRDLRARKDPTRLLTAILDGEITLSRAYQLGEQGYVDDKAARAKAEADVDVRPRIAPWLALLAKQGKGQESITKYQQQLNVLFPLAQPFTIGLLTTRELWARIDAVPVAETTKGRYRAAVSSFCAYLCRVGVLNQNPVRDITGYPQATVRMTSLSPDQALQLIRALPQPNAAIDALMYACGWELSACKRATVGDVDLTEMTALARGTKTAWRHRLTVITDPAVVEVLRPVLRNRLPLAKLFHDVQWDTARRLRNTVAASLGLPETTWHDYRHTYAIKELKAGTPPQHVAQMLGLSTTALLFQRYGRYVATPGELQAVAKARREAM